MTFIELWFLLGFIALGIQMGESGEFNQNKESSSYFYDGVLIIIMGAISFGNSLEDISKASRKMDTEVVDS